MCASEREEMLAACVNTLSTSGDDEHAPKLICIPVVGGRDDDTDARFKIKAMSFQLRQLGVASSRNKLRREFLLFVVAHGS